MRHISQPEIKDSCALTSNVLCVTPRTSPHLPPPPPPAPSPPQAQGILSEIRAGTIHEIDDAFAIARCLVDGGAFGFKGPAAPLKSRACDIFTLTIVHILSSPAYPKKTLAACVAFLRDARRSDLDRFEEMLDSYNHFVAFLASIQLERSIDAAGNIVAEVKAYLPPFSLTARRS